MEAYVYVCKRGNRVVAVFDDFNKAIDYMTIQFNLNLPHSYDQESWTVLPIHSTLSVEKMPYNPSSHEYPSRNHN